MERAETPVGTADLIDALLRRLGLDKQRGRIEIEFDGGQMRRLWTHGLEMRSDVDRYDPSVDVDVTGDDAFGV